MNVLGVSFDCKLNWQTQIQNSITKAKKALNAIKIISKYFNKNELLTLITANYYSVLYYNSEIWHLTIIVSICTTSKNVCSLL